MTRLMQKLVNEMNYLDKTNDLTFPLEEKWENLPTGLKKRGNYHA